jgi:hypothetical protein
MFVIGHGIDEPEDMFTAIGIETVQQNGIGGAVLLRQLQFGIAHDDFAIVGDAQLGSDLQHNFDFFTCGHGASWLLGCCSLDAAGLQNGT